MKPKTLLLLFLLIITGSATAAPIEYILRLAPIEINQRSPHTRANEVRLPTPFAEPVLTDPSDLERIQNGMITRIELVYTRYRSSESFDQQALNEQRLLALERLIPGLFDQQLIEWVNIEQTGCDSPEACDGFFHGFVIFLREPTTAETSARELEMMHEVLAGRVPGYYTDPRVVTSYRDASKWDKPKCPVSYETDSDSIDVSSIEHVSPFYTGGVDAMLRDISKSMDCETSTEASYEVQFTIDLVGRVKSAGVKAEGDGECAGELFNAISTMREWHPARIKGMRVTETVNIVLITKPDGTVALKNRKGKRHEIDPEALEECLTHHRRFIPKITYRPSMDSTVFKIFNRHPEWNDMLVICDFTGSMGPYTSQLLLWHKLNLEANDDRTKHFTFFNDGDYTPDHDKVTGQVGGIYHGLADDFSQVEKLAIETMTNGSGGDCPENNLEAALEALERCPSCKEVVMIVDNFATPRDMKLLRHIDQPIRVIVCGGWGGINPAYLKLARKTGGSVHTMESDLENLSELNEGSQITIDGQDYIIRNGAFQRLYKS